MWAGAGKWARVKWARVKWARGYTDADFFEDIRVDQRREVPELMSFVVTWCVFAVAELGFRRDTVHDFLLRNGPSLEQVSEHSRQRSKSHPSLQTSNTSPCWELACVDSTSKTKKSFELVGYVLLLWKSTLLWVS